MTAGKGWAALYRPGRCWSLLDMLKLPVSDLLVVSLEMHAMRSFVQHVEKIASPGLDPHQNLGTDTIHQQNEHLTRLREAVDELPTPLTKRAISRLLEVLDNPKMDFSVLKEHLASILARVRDELDELHCFALKADSKAYFDDAAPPWGDEVEKAFPTATYDISEAGKCLALRRSTACVTHLMRALEVGLAVIAKPFGVDSDRKNWGNVIDEVQSKIKTMNATSHGQDWKSQQEFFSGAGYHFQMLKDGWRNHAMHVRAKYTEEEAEDIYRSTRGFMRLLSQRLSE
jgi:hypothetical protein